MTLTTAQTTAGTTVMAFRYFVDPTLLAEIAAARQATS